MAAELGLLPWSMRGIGWIPEHAAEAAEASAGPDQEPPVSSLGGRTAQRAALRLPAVEPQPAVREVLDPQPDEAPASVSLSAATEPAEAWELRVAPGTSMRTLIVLTRQDLPDHRRQLLDAILHAADARVEARFCFPPITGWKLPKAMRAALPAAMDLWCRRYTEPPPHAVLVEDSDCANLWLSLCGMTTLLPDTPLLPSLEQMCNQPLDKALAWKQLQP